MTLNHIHQYRRVDIGKEEPYYVMQCADSECNHHIAMQSKLSAPSLRGKLSICNKCESVFKLSRRALRMAEPVCDECVRTKITKKHEVADVEAFFRKMEEGLK